MEDLEFCNRDTDFDELVAELGVLRRKQVPGKTWRSLGN